MAVAVAVAVVVVVVVVAILTWGVQNDHRAETLFQQWVRYEGDDFLSVADIRRGLHALDLRLSHDQVTDLVQAASAAQGKRLNSVDSLDMEAFQQFWDHHIASSGRVASSRASARPGSRPASRKQAWDDAGGAGAAASHRTPGALVAARDAEAVARSHLLDRLLRGTAHHRLAVSASASGANSGMFAGFGSHSARSSRGSSGHHHHQPVVSTAKEVVQGVGEQLGGVMGVAAASGQGPALPASGSAQLGATAVPLPGHHMGRPRATLDADDCFLHLRDVLHAKRVTASDLFSALDTDRDGFLSQREWMGGMACASGGRGGGDAVLARLSLVDAVQGLFSRQQLESMYQRFGSRSQYVHACSPHSPREDAHRCHLCAVCVLCVLCVRLVDFDTFADTLAREGAAFREGVDWEEGVFQDVRAWACEFDGVRAASRVHPAPRSADDVTGVRAVYSVCDVNRVGALRSYEDLQRGLACIGVELSGPQAERIFKLLDTDRDGAVVYDDVARRCTPKHFPHNWMEVAIAAAADRLQSQYATERAAFDGLNRSRHSQGLSCDDFVRALRGHIGLPRDPTMNAAMWGLLFRGIDRDGDGYISGAEFSATFGSAWSAIACLARATVDTFGHLHTAFETWDTYVSNDRASVLPW